MIRSNVMYYFWNYREPYSFERILHEKNFVCFPSVRIIFILTTIIFHRSRYLISRSLVLHMKENKILQKILLVFKLGDGSIRYVMCFCYLRNKSILIMT